ncbi:MAG: DUF3489 domain-containing protein [Janthinobacterium lividum]
MTTPRPQTPAPSTSTTPAARPKLSDAALLLLGQAAVRADRMLLPPPATLRTRGGALQKVLQVLLKAGFVTEVPAETEVQSWRSGDGDQRIGLIIADEGFRAIGLPVPVSEPAATTTAEPARTTKQATLIALLSVEAGASVPVLTETLAWQAHTVRAALTGLRQKGHVLARSKDAAGTTVYRITGQVMVTDAPGAGVSATTAA